MQRYGSDIGHKSVRHSSKLQSLQVNGNEEEDDDDERGVEYDDDDNGFRLAEVVAGILAVSIKIMLHNKTPKNITDCRYSTGIPLNMLVLLGDLPLGEPLSARILPEPLLLLSARILPKPLLSLSVRILPEPLLSVRSLPFTIALCNSFSLTEVV